MNHDTSFVVSRFENRNGVTSWRVSGYLAGVRIRRNFPTREEAAAEKAALERKALQCASGIRAATTFLADDQLREAEATFRRLKDGLRWSPETGQVGSLTQSQHNDPYVKETTSAQSRSESPGRLGSPEGH